MATQMDRKSAAAILNSRKLVNKVGKFTLKVTSAQPFLRTNKDQSTTAVTIVNFAGMTTYQVQKATELFKAGKYQEATNLNLSASQLQGQYVPSKGEIVDVEIDTIKNNDGIDILVVGTIVARQAEAAARISGFGDDDSSSISVEDMREFLIESGEVTKAKANKLSDAEVSEAYAEAKEAAVTAEEQLV